MASWKTDEHLVDHYGVHRHEFPGISIGAYDASAQETLVDGVFFSYRDRITGPRRTGCYDRQTARMTVLDSDGLILSHFRCAEDYVADLPYSTYRS